MRAGSDGSPRRAAPVHTSAIPLAGAAFSAAALAAAAAAVYFTWQRLFVGVDLLTESYYVLGPWRWVLGARPFAHDNNLLQIAGLLEYPFLKLFGLVRHNDPTGLILYTRHLYLLLQVAVAVVAFFLLRRLVRWQLALVITATAATYIQWATPQLDYDTMAMAFLTLSSVLGAWVVVFHRGSRYAVASGAALGLAVACYPTLAPVVPFVALSFFLAQRKADAEAGPEASTSEALGRSRLPVTGRVANVVAMGAGVVAVLLPFGLLLLSFGASTIRASVAATLHGSQANGQLGGAQKAETLLRAAWDLATWQPALVVGLVLAFLVVRYRPRAGRLLLVALPLVLWVPAQRSGLTGAGYVIAYAMLAPYLYLFLPGRRRAVGARLLVWIWLPSVLAGCMTAYSSAFAFENAQVGLAPGMMLSGLFLCWALEGSRRGARAPSDESPEATATDAPAPGRTWLALCALVGIVAVAISLQFQYQQGSRSYRELDTRISSGPWAGIRAEAGREQSMDRLAADLRAQSHPGDSLLIFYTGTGYYLFWRGPIVTDSYGLTPRGDPSILPRTTLDYFRRTGSAPTLVLRLMKTGGLSPKELAAGAGGLQYPPVVVRPGYVIYRRPSSETTAQVIARLPHE